MATLVSNDEQESMVIDGVGDGNKVLLYAYHQILLLAVICLVFSGVRRCDRASRSCRDALKAGSTSLTRYASAFPRSSPQSPAAPRPPLRASVPRCAAPPPPSTPPPPAALRPARRIRLPPPRRVSRPASPSPAAPCLRHPPRLRLPPLCAPPPAASVFRCVVAPSKILGAEFDGEHTWSAAHCDCADAFTGDGARDPDLRHERHGRHRLEVGPDSCRVGPAAHQIFPWKRVAAWRVPHAVQCGCDWIQAKISMPIHIHKGAACWNPRQIFASKHHLIYIVLFISVLFYLVQLRTYTALDQRLPLQIRGRIGTVPPVDGQKNPPPSGIRRRVSCTAGDDKHLHLSVARCALLQQLGRPLFNRRKARSIHPAVLAAGDISAFRRRVLHRPTLSGFTVALVQGPYCHSIFFRGSFCKTAA